MDKKLRDAERVARLLEDNDLVEAFKSVESDIKEMWSLTKSDEIDKREELYRELHGLQSVYARLKRTVNVGKLAEPEQDLAQVAEERKEFLRTGLTKFLV